ncbi:MAG: hypothetical protein LBQ67_02830 [Treponema sp.]|nr:hypothetical protein [Treponema sp.]
MKKNGVPFRILYILCLAGILFISFPAHAQVNRDELGNLGSVEFINYEGPYSRIETRAQIRAIGYSQGVMVRNNIDRTGISSRYFVIHSVSPGDGTKLDADVFGLGADVGVDHIRNLRLILQGYLEGAYGYSERDAALLAEYVTVYNVVYREDWEYFGSRYKSSVMENLSREKTGLSIRYDEWPGRTLMLVPLGMGSAGPLNAVDTTSITDSRVTEQLRQEPDRGVDTRQGMVDLKERQSEEAGQQAEVQREAVREEEQRIAREREEAARQRERAQQEQQQVAQERRQPDANQERLDQREEAARQQEREADEKDQQLDQREEDLEDRKQEAEETQEFADQKAEEARQDREEIARDQQAMINQENLEQTPVEGILGASILSLNGSLGRVVKLNPDNGQEVKRSPLNTVNARTLTLSGGKIIAIAGENRGSGAVRLIEINRDTLEMVKQGEDDISPQSLLWANGSDLYAVSSSGGNLYLARFNTDLVRQARSSVTVHPYGGIAFSDGYIVTQRSDGSAVLLNPGDLSEKR